MKRIALVALVLFVGCSKKSDVLDRSDSGVADTGADPDSGVPPDAGSEPEDSGVPEDSGIEPARQLIEYSLFGTSPVSNLVVSPEFDLYTNAWFALSLDGQALADQTKYHHPDTPTRQPALAFSSLNGALLVGTTRSTSGALTASVWIGYEGGIEERVTATVAFIGTDTSGGSVAFDLVPDESTRMTAGGRVWIRYWGMIGEAPVGFAQLYVQEQTGRRTFVSGPVVVPASRSELSGRRLSARTELEEGARLALAELRRRMRDSLGEPPPSFNLR